jgi:hypothetical protein
MILLSIGIEIDPKGVLEATFVPRGSPLWSRVRGPQPLATRDTLEVVTRSGSYFVRGDFAYEDAMNLRTAGAAVTGLDPQ